MSAEWIAPLVTVPGPKPVTAVPALTPRLPVTLVGPVFVTVEPASTAKVEAAPRDGEACAGFEDEELTEDETLEDDDDEETDDEDELLVEREDDELERAELTLEAELDGGYQMPDEEENVSSIVRPMWYNRWIIFLSCSIARRARL